jgi:hypothetical protein
VLATEDRPAAVHGPLNHIVEAQPGSRCKLGPSRLASEPASAVYGRQPLPSLGERLTDVMTHGSGAWSHRSPRYPSMHRQRATVAPICLPPSSSSRDGEGGSVTASSQPPCAPQSTCTGYLQGSGASVQRCPPQPSWHSHMKPTEPCDSSTQRPPCWQSGPSPTPPLGGAGIRWHTCTSHSEPTQPCERQHHSDMRSAP